ncbi:MAG: hypothetical protein QMC67_13310 [Candidatus Wallbacteria bacterium]
MSKSNDRQYQATKYKIALLKEFIINNNIKSKEIIFRRLKDTNEEKFSLISKISKATFYRWLNKLNFHLIKDEIKFGNISYEQKYQQLAQNMNAEIITKIKMVFIPTHSGYSEKFIHEAKSIPEYKSLVINSVRCENGTGIIVFFNVSTPDNRDKVNKIIDTLNKFIPSRKNKKISDSIF